MTDIERLARDICWAEFPRRPQDTTKASYWRGVHPTKQADYIRDAEWLVFITKKLKPLRVLSLVDFRSAGRRSRKESLAN